MSDDPRDQWDWTFIRQRCALEAYRIVRGRHDAEEVVQEALVRGWRNRVSCRTPESPLPWFLRITRNEAFRLIAREQRARPAASTFGEDQEVSDPGALRDHDRALLAIDVARALEDLSPSERLLIGLRYAQDCSHPEIARQLNIPEATARVRLHRAQKRLRSVLDPPT